MYKQEEILLLDDLVLIHHKDGQDALGLAEKQWQQLEHDFELADIGFEPKNIVFAGMGGSALAAELAMIWPGVSVPFVISRNYDAPRFISNTTLFIASSYSGNTEETLSALAQAEVAGAAIVVIASGGKLLERAQEKNYPIICLPHISQPRYAALYSFKAIMTIFLRTKLIAESDFMQIPLAAERLRAVTAGWRPDIATKDNLAKQIALDVIGKSVVIYGGPYTYPAAYKWKIGFNENAKNVAWVNQYPEFNHNEFIGWTSHPLDKTYAVIDLQSSFERSEIKKRFAISSRLLSGRRPAPITVEAVGDTVLDQLLWLMALGDFVSIYVAILNGLNPTPIDLIEKLKKELA